MTLPVLALTLWQPWASLVMAGVKPWEWRRWWPPRAYIGRRIVIHAGARKMPRNELQDLLLSLDDGDTSLNPAMARPIIERALTSPGSLPLACGLGTAILGEPLLVHDWLKRYGLPTTDERRIDRCAVAWPMLDVQPFPHLIPCKGAQGFWKWPKDLAPDLANAAP